MDTNNQRRNVVMIFCDQLRPDFLNAYGGDFIPTPNIDALAKNGVVFDNAITASTVCAPARASVISGKHVSGHDAWTNDIPCKEGTEFFPQRLNAAGYMTAAVGCFDHPYAGYQYINKFVAGGEYKDYINSKYPDETQAYPTDGLQFKYVEEDHYDRRSADKAIDFIESYTSTGTAPDGTKPDQENAPFFLACGFLSPHSPYLPPKEMEGTVDINKIPKIKNIVSDDVAEVEKTRRAFLNSHEALVNPEAFEEERMEKRRAYCEMIVEIDALVGRIVQSLKDNGVYENTTIIFTGDHGSCEDDYNLCSKGPYPYSAQLFISMIVSNDPRLKKGTHCDALCGNMDVGATVLDIAGDQRAFGMSRSLIGLANGTVPEREVNMSEFCDSSKTIVDKRHTFIYYPFTGKTRLFDRVEDPEETIDFSGDPKYAEVERKFLMHCIDFMILSKGVRMEAHDLVPSAQEGIKKKHPNFLDDFDVAYPIGSMTAIERLKQAGLPYDYNEFCRTREIKAHYGVYFFNEKK